MEHGWENLLDGILMSDGNLTIPGQCRSPRYQQTCKEPTFLEWVASWLPTPGRISGPHASGKYQYWLLSTRTDPLYSAAYQRWYPDGRKRLPGDLQITPPLLLTEYLGDGFLLADAARRIQRLELGTYGFAREDLREIVVKLEREGLKFRLKANKALYLNGSQVCKFLRYIGPCPVPALAYKWRQIAVEERPWRQIACVKQYPSPDRCGGVVEVTLECGHVFRKPASRLRSPKTHSALCRLCGNNGPDLLTREAPHSV